jgi:hypothetical protein
MKSFLRKKIAKKIPKQLASAPFVLGLGMVLLGLSGCLEQDKIISTDTQSFTFSGATSANNLDASRVQISWSTPPSQAALISISNYVNGALIPLVTLPASTASPFVLTQLTADTQYNFVVQALTSGNQSDGNTNVASAFTFGGVNATAGSAPAAGSTSGANIFYTAPGSGASAVNIYCKTNFTADTLVGTNTNYTQSSAAITNLASGTNYTCHAQAVSLTTGLQDTNTATTSFQTNSLGYGMVQQNGASPPLNAAYEGVITVQAFGDAPTAPTHLTAPAAVPAPSPTVGVKTPIDTPTARVVNVTWRNFSISNPTTAAYRLVRVAAGGTFVMNTSTTCTSTTLTACQVCISSSGLNSVSRTCQDANIAPSPQQYEYAISLIVNANSVPQLAEEMPVTPGDQYFRIQVPIPPSNMVLIHRDSVNYEMCALMNRQSNPLAHQSCSYSGIGAVPYATLAQGLVTPLNLTNNVYDFGYNLFLDRWEAGCNWTTQTGGGMCGASATAGNCTGTAAPASTVGIDGNVFYTSAAGTTSQCYVHQGGSWIAIQNTRTGTAITTPNLAASYTNAPNRTNQIPPMTNLTQASAWDICQAVSDSTYGPKRLMRRREDIAASAFPWVSGDAGRVSVSGGVLSTSGNLSPAQITALEDSVQHWKNQGCSTNNHNGISAAAFNTAAQVQFNSDTGQGGFTIGSDYTTQCSSRFGAQDLVGNVDEWVSDQTDMTCVSSNCTLATSTLDEGNRDYINGGTTYAFDDVTGPNLSSGQSISGYPALYATFTGGANGAGYMNIPLGLPMYGSDNGNAPSITSVSSNIEESYYAFYAYNGVQSGLMVGGAASYISPSYGNAAQAGRFFIQGFNSINSANYMAGFRCALPAQ